MFCPTEAIDFDQQDELIVVKVGNIVLATGYDLFDARRIPQLGYGRLANVFNSLEFERLSNAAGPTGGKIVLRDGVTPPQSVAIVHCVGSRDRNYNRYCSSICCMQSLKFAHLVHERLPGLRSTIFTSISARRAKATKSSTISCWTKGPILSGTGGRGNGRRPPSRRGRQAHRPGRGYPRRRAAAHPGRHGRPFRRAAIARRFQRGCHQIRHLV